MPAVSVRPVCRIVSSMSLMTPMPARASGTSTRPVARHDDCPAPSGPTSSSSAVRQPVASGDGLTTSKEAYPSTPATDSCTSPSMVARTTAPGTSVDTNRW